MSTKSKRDYKDSGGIPSESAPKSGDFAKGGGKMSHPTYPKGGQNLAPPAAPKSIAAPKAGKPKAC